MIASRPGKKVKAEVQPRKKPQQERSAKVVERILDAALVLIKEHGVDAVTTIAIAQRAELSVGSLYQYYPNKDAITLELARRWLAEFPAELTSIQQGSIPKSWKEFAAQMHRFLQEIGALYLSYAALLPIVNAMYGKPGLDQIIRKHDAGIVQRHAKWLQSINPSMKDAVANRLGLVMLEIGNACLSTAINLSKGDFNLVLKDLEIMHLELLRPHLGLK